jgi:hypothetical protein
VKRIEKLRELFPEFKNLKAYLGIASFSFSDEVLEKARECGVGIIRRVGNHIEMDVANESVDNPYKSSDVARDCIKELKLDRQICWDDPIWGVYATSKHSRSARNGVKWDEEREIDSQAEQFFRDAFAKSMTFGGIKYDEIKFDLGFDIVLINENSITIIEIRNGTHPAFVQEFIGERLEKFRESFPEYRNRKFYLGIAGFLFSKKVMEKAKECGVSIIKRDDNFSTLPPNPTPREPQ